LNTHIKALLAPARYAVKTYWPAILAIQCLSLAVVFSYYQLDEARSCFASIAATKSQGGIFFVILSTVCSGGILPEVLKRIFSPQAAKPSTPELLHQFLMWAGVGILVDKFYQLQSALFGQQTDLFTLFCKILFDQLLFAPFICIPLIISWFALYECRYNLHNWRRQLSVRNIVHRTLPLWMTSLCFWPFMLSAIYSLPADLQFPLFLFANAAYSILMIFIARNQVAATNQV